MSAAVPAAETIAADEHNAYARSLHTLLRVGAIAVRGGTVEMADEGVFQLLREDFVTGALENLRTAPGVENHLDIERRHTHRIVDGQAVAADGTPMVDIIRRGRQKAQETAVLDMRMRIQAHRDEGDLVVAERADALRPGQMLLAVSLPPLEELATDPKFWGNLGYRPDLSYIQTYYKTENGEVMIASSLSVGACDKGAWERVLRQLGVTVPADARSDDFIRSFQVMNVTPHEAQCWGLQVRERYYQAVGERHQRKSVTDYLNAQDAVVRQYFERYMLPLAEAVYTGRNSMALQGFAQALLDAPGLNRFSPEVADEIVKVANMRAFPRSAGSVMENLVRYALVERLRAGLVAVVDGATLRSVQIMPVAGMAYETLHLLMARDVTSGVSAGRSYGGCASLALGSESSSESPEPLEAYGGRDGKSKESWVWKTGTCRVKNCPSPSPTEVGPCSVCRRCQHAFDVGRDPSKTAATPRLKRETPLVNLAHIFASGGDVVKPERPAQKARSRHRPSRELGYLMLAV